jgi:hypothetical protein
MVSTKNVIVTDFGEVPLPDDINALFNAAKKTKAHRIDKRTREGRFLAKWKCRFLSHPERFFRPIFVYPDA